MTLLDINALRDDLLVLLAERKATGGSPVNVSEACKELRPEIDWETNKKLAKSAGLLLVKHNPPFARSMQESDMPNALFLALTEAGKSEACRISVAKQPLGFADTLASDKVQKISALVVSCVSLAVSVAALVVAYLAYQAP